MAAPETLQRGTSATVIARHLRSEIEAGRYRHEEQLPSTRALAEEWNTSVATIARAMQQLGEQGLVVTRDRSSRLVNYPDQHRRDHGAPTVLVVGGYAGSGKTEFGRILARATGWPMLDKDSTTRPVVEAALAKLGESPNDREGEVYLNVVRPAEYEALRETMIENVQCGNSVIMTAPFIRELGDAAWCQRLTAELDALGAVAHAVWVRCDIESMRTYLTRRGAARDASKLANWADYVSKLELGYKPEMPHTIVQNSLSSAPLTAQAQQLLGSLGVEARR
ncbi:GntR family transcriptional regulator (plasmid) [Amycolatopsis sp. FU40]|uniref:GntR family transcriptional regulator n=1 Tax=Amycolatopsis sp. FU40 TaxID=2914159 RepID=UPI001F0142A6|nr:GntR family transcriptional regulator [Amycolatopsis sp. FU40]UKD50730.1 GntR family transcriptional regulator [Amycolatopsis sp. FU40]